VESYEKRTPYARTPERQEEKGKKKRKILAENGHIVSKQLAYALEIMFHKKGSMRISMPLPI
jgi:hypothetical protein